MTGELRRLINLERRRKINGFASFGVRALTCRVSVRANEKKPPFVIKAVFYWLSLPMPHWKFFAAVILKHFARRRPDHILERFAGGDANGITV